MAQNLLLYSFGYVSAINLAMLFPLQTDASTTGISDIDEVVENETNGGKISSTGDDQENLELSLPSHSGLVTDSIFISLLLKNIIDLPGGFLVGEKYCSFSFFQATLLSASQILQGIKS